MNGAVVCQHELFKRLLHVWGYGLFWYVGPVAEEDADCTFLGLYVKQFGSEKRARAWQKENQANGLQNGIGSNLLH